MQSSSALMFESLFQKLSSLRRRDSDDAIDDMVNASVKNEGPSEDIKHDAEDIPATGSVSPQDVYKRQGVDCTS